MAQSMLAGSRGGGQNLTYGPPHFFSLHLGSIKLLKACV